MAAYFFDSSAIVKRYLAETGSTWVLEITEPEHGNRLYVAGITCVEVTAAVTRRQRNGDLSEADTALVLEAFREDLAHQYRQVAISSSLLDRAMAIAEAHALRGYDAVQLSAALEVYRHCQEIEFPLALVSADAALNEAAEAEGIAVDDPNDHP